jgi:glucoside 3-dehydrogenase (cytochrome c) hitch-hiker subunit
MTNDDEITIDTITRREAIQRVTAMLGGFALVGGTSLIAACEKAQQGGKDTAATAGPQQAIGQFTPQDIAYLDEIADTILPTTSTPGAKAAKTGAFMALMVTDTYEDKDAAVFRAGMTTLDEASKKANNGAGFMAATPQQRLTLLEQLDKEAKAHMDARNAAREKSKGGKPTEAEKKAAQALPDQRKEAAPGADVGAATAITADTPSHYFRMMKELAMLGYFTSEIGCKQAMRYIESPGRFDPCVPYAPGEKSWAPHA